MTTTWTATSSDVVLATSDMKRIVVAAGKESGKPFTVEKDGVLYRSYGVEAPKKVAVVELRPGVTMIRCPRCFGNRRPVPGTTKLAAHVRPGTKEMCR